MKLNAGANFMSGLNNILEIMSFSHLPLSLLLPCLSCQAVLAMACLLKMHKQNRKNFVPDRKDGLRSESL